jgi:hypothetical protein
MFARSGRGGWAYTLPVAAGVLIHGAGCRSAAPLLGSDREPAHGTVSGVVAGPDGVAPVRGRLVEAIRVETRQRYSAVTSAAGSYTIKLPSGRYRLEVEFAEGEETARSPGVVDVDERELVTEVDFVLGGAGVVQ